MVRRPAGVTLIEALIVFSLISLLLGLVTMYFSRGQQYTADTEAYSSLQREANITLSRMKEHLYRSTAEHLQVGLGSPGHIYFLSFRPATPGQPEIEFGGMRGEVTWKKWMCFFLDEESKTIYQSEIPLAPPTHVLSPSPEPAVSFGSFSSAAGKPIGHRVENLAFEKSGRGVTIRLTVQGISPVPLRTEHDKIIRLSSTLRVSLSN